MNTEAKGSKVIIDTDWVLDPGIRKVSDILMNKGEGLLTFRATEVIVAGVKRFAVELNIATEQETLLAAVRRAGLKVLENVENTEEEVEE